MQKLNAEIETYKNGSKSERDEFKRERDEFLVTKQVYESQIITLESQLKVWKEMQKGHDGVEQLTTKLANFY